MLNSFRAFSGSITTKILMLLLIASFAMWGIGDMLNHSGGSAALATVGGRDVSVQEYYRQFALETEQVKRALGTNYSPELLKRLNVPQAVLQRMIQESLLAQEAERMGLVPDDTHVVMEIRKNPAFISRSGTFDKTRFENALRAQAVSEKTYIERLRSQLATDRLMDSVMTDLPVTPAMVSTLQAAMSQGRIIDLYLLSGNMFPPAAAPTDAELTAFHHDHAELFTAPEYRTVSFVRFSASDAASKEKPVSEEALRAYYSAHQDQYQAPERREVEQLLYNSEEKALDAYKLIGAGKSFADVATTTEPLNKKNLSLGPVEKKSILENAADKVFSLKEGGFTEPVQSPFGWHIFRVSKIIPAGTEPFEKMRATIETQIKQSGREDVLTQRMNQMEDALAGGSTLAEAAKGMGLPVEQAGTFDKMGNTPQGTPDAQLPKLDKFVDVAFKTDEKTESSVTASKDGSYYVLRVESVTPEKLRPLAEVKGEVAKAYEKARTDKLVADLASVIDKELATARPAAEIISAHKLQPATSGTVLRDSHELGGNALSPALIKNIFAADVGALTSPVRDKNGNYLLASIRGLAPKSAPTGDSGTQKKDMTQSMQEEMMQQYLRYLELRYPVTIHEDMLDQLLRDASDASR